MESFGSSLVTDSFGPVFKYLHNSHYSELRLEVPRLTVFSFLVNMLAGYRRRMMELFLYKDSCRLRFNTGILQQSSCRTASHVDWE